MKHSRHDKKRWENQYKSGKNVSEISGDEDVHEQTIYSHLQKSDVKVRSGASRQKKYDCDDEYFSCIDKPNKSYWLEFISADGYVRSGDHKNVLGIGLSPKDEEHLKKFRDDISASYPIKEYESSETSVLEISSKQICDDLSDYGIVPNKTEFLAPVDLPKNLQIHYWRGMVDGDGWVGFYENRHGYEKAYMGLSGTRQVVERFSTFVSSFTGHNRSLRKRDGNWSIEFSSEITKKILKKLYKSCGRKLNRKYKLVKKAVEYQNKDHRNGNSLCYSKFKDE